MSRGREMKISVFIIIFLLFFSMTIVLKAENEKAADDVTLGNNVYLWPLLYYRQDVSNYDYKLQVLFPLFHQNKKTTDFLSGHFANVVYNRSEKSMFLGIIPVAIFYKSKDEPLNFVTPLGWKIDKNKGFLNIWWRPNYEAGKGYFHFFPIVFSWRDDKDELNYMFLPFFSKFDSTRGIGPVYWAYDFIYIFPIFFEADSCKNLFLYPIFDKKEGNYGILPLWAPSQLVSLSGLFLFIDDLFDVAFDPRNAIPPNYAFIGFKKNAFHMFPLFWIWGEDWENFLVVPLGWRIGDNSAVLNVLWGENYFHIFPLFLHWNNNWVLPLLFSWKVNDNYGFGPVFWGENYRHILPLYFSWGNNWIMLPLLSGKIYDKYNVGPVLWGENYFHILPLFFKWEKNYAIPPLLSWRINEKYGIGPVLWGKEHLHFIPLFFYTHNSKGKECFILPLLTSIWNKKNSKGFVCIPLFTSHNVNLKRDEKVTRFLWKLFYRFEDDNRFEFEINPFVSYVNIEEKEKNFSILWRLFQYNKKSSGEKYIRILFSPQISFGKDD